MLGLAYGCFANFDNLYASKPTMQMKIRTIKAASRLGVNILLCLSGMLLLSTCQLNHHDRKANDTGEFRFLETTISEMQQGYRDHNYTIREVVEDYLNRIEKIDHSGPVLGSIITINPDALQIAEALDKEMRAGKIRGPLHGIPVVLKDNIDTHDGMPTTAGSRALRHSFPVQDSYIAAKLREAGAVIIGKANLSEWANFRGELSTSGWSGLGGQTKNPYDLSRNPCGSSSGSAVAVSANLCMLAIGTETDGSIVCPSHSNGIVGIKPTVGLASRSGIIPISFTQDTPGPMARSLTDAVICLGALIGVDSADSKTLESPGKVYSDYTPFLKKDGLKGKRIGLYKGTFGISYKVDALVNETVEFLKSQGAEIVGIDTIYDPEVDRNSFEIMLYEYKDGLNRYFASLGPDAPVKSVDDLIAFNASDSVELSYFNQKYLELASAKGDLTSESYQKALTAMLEGSRKNGIDKVMDQHQLDAIMAPTGAPAWKTDLVNGDSYHLGSSSAAAQAGYPNITVPMGFVDGLPVGISFFGRAWSEPVLIEIAYGYESNTKNRRPPGFLSGN